MTPEQVAMVAFASSRLNDGRAPGEAFGDLVGIGVEPRQAAVAVCVAAGNSPEAADQRSRWFDQVWQALDPSVQHTAGALLEEHGFFDLDVALDEEQSQIAAALRYAITAAGYVPSAHAQAVLRLIRTARLREALLYLDDLGEQRWLENRRFWAELVHAADGLLVHDPSMAEVRRRCAERA